MSIFILVTVSLFAVLFYKNTSDIMLREGKSRIEATINDLDSQLSTINEPMTKENVNQIFEDAIKNAKDDRDSYLIANAAQRETYIYIYNSQNDLLFENHQNKELNIKNISTKPKLMEVNGVPGYILKKTIYSNKTGQSIGYVQVFYELTNLYKIKKDIFHHIFIFMLIWLVVVYIFEVMISNHFIKPIKKLSETIEDIKDNPMTTKRVPVPKTNDEIGSLTQLFNGVLDQMQRYIEQQDQFVSDVSHELRTPVTIIEGHLNLLQRWGKDDPDVLEESLQVSVQEVERMKELIQEMLELSRLEQTNIKRLKGKANAKEVISQVINNFQMIHPDFIFIFDDELQEDLEIDVYRNHLEQLLIILVDNAVKYSNEEMKVVRILVSKDSNNLVIGVKDYGVGISQKDITKIFDRFYRVDKARSRQKGGNGLGLTIAQKLIDIYNGELEVESSLGVGTTFKVKFPIIVDEENNTI